VQFRLYLGFSRIVVNAPDIPESGMLYLLWAASLDNPIPRLATVKKKRKLFQEYTPMSPSSFVLPHSAHDQLEEY
jgi:hypothetical protein